MYRVLYWIGTLPPKCDLRLLNPKDAHELVFNFQQRGFSAHVVSGKYACSDAEAGYAPLRFND